MADEVSIQKNKWEQIRDYLGEVRGEMRRVTWPGKQEIYGTTLMVVATTFLFGFYFAVCDQAFSRIVSKVLAYFEHRG